MFEKLKYLVTEICKENNDLPSVEIIENSIISGIDKGNVRNNIRYRDVQYDLLFSLNPKLYIKFVDDLDRISNIIKHYFNKVSDNTISIGQIEIKPDYEKITILNSNVSIIDTPWEEINNLQKKLIENIKIANSSIDFQNIGNTARTIMDKLSRLIYNPSIHIAPDNIDVSNGKFKNQLHTYINSVLKGNENKELKSFSLSAINFTEDSIDLMNKTTHKLNVKKQFGEVCVISTIGVISLIKAINEK